ncbi:unnamed protein product [Clonostachys solani]|uniref:Uncharacterized protein n=1 Tax=Clonostachys solani TaxID=160281 RepID=A0A9N9ZLG5_9HYPO|nr:unnamed protein product [Clonostachys solani]
MSNAEVPYEDEDIRSSPAHKQVVELSTLGSHAPHPVIATAAAFEPVKCLLRLIQQVYYILTIQSALVGQRFRGDAAAEAQNHILRLAWVRRPLHAVEDCGELICSQLGLEPHNDTFDLVFCDAMAATLWNRPEFYIDDVLTNRAPNWKGYQSIPRFFYFQVIRQHSAPIVDDNLPAIFKFVCSGYNSEKYVPTIFAVTLPGEQIIETYDWIENPCDVVYALMAIVEKRRGKKPAVKRFNPLAYRVIRQEIIPHVVEGRSRFVIFYAKFRRGDLDLGGRVQRMLNIGDRDGALARPVEEPLPGLMEGLDLGDGQADVFGVGQAIIHREGTPPIDDRQTKRTRR